MTKWISVRDSLPEDGKRILCISSSNIIYTKMYEEGIFYDGTTYCYCPDGKIANVTHWMPLPEVPK